MTFPKKSSRGATVDGKPYRFIVKAWDDHGLVEVRIEDSTYPGRMLTTKVYGATALSRGIGGPQIGVLVRSGRAAGWKPEAGPGHFALDELTAAWALEDDAEHKTFRMDGVVAMFEEHLRKGNFTGVNGCLTIPKLGDSATTIVGILRATRDYADKLPARQVFFKNAEKQLRERHGDDLTDRLLASHR